MYVIFGDFVIFVRDFSVISRGVCEKKSVICPSLELTLRFVHETGWFD